MTDKEKAPAQTGQQPTDSKELFERATRIALQMDLLKNPEDTLAALGNTEIFDKWLKMTTFAIVQEVAKVTGADPAQLADPERRTKEQQEAIEKAGAYAAMNRINIFLESNYTAALFAIAGKDGPDNEDLTLQDLAVLYFFALHPDIDPRQKAALTDANKKELNALFAEMCEFLKENPKAKDSGILKCFMEHQIRKTAGLPRLKAVRPEMIEYPLDKINSIIWGLLEKDTGGQLAIAVEKSGSKNQIDVLYSIDFDFEELPKGITVTKRLTPFDKRVYIAISSLYNAGNTIITLTQMYYAMGNSGKPSSNQLKRIYNAVTKMASARVFVDNTQEATAYKYDKFVYDGALLPMERGTALVNGQLADAAIHPLREPPIMTFAKDRNQITTVSVKLLQSPFNKTDANLAIDDYLLERISRAKKGNQPHRILFKTLFDHAKITTKKQRDRAPDKVKGYLAYYQQCGFIKRFTVEKDGVTIYF